MAGTKCAKAQNSRKLSEKCFEASGLDISVPKQGKKGERERRKGKEGKGRKRRKGRKGNRKESQRKENKGTTAIRSDIVCKIA